ncbi:hypothetical protein Tco_0560530, partial [Tanacetum coccineum]
MLLATTREVEEDDEADKAAGEEGGNEGAVGFADMYHNMSQEHGDGIADFKRRHQDFQSDGVMDLAMALGQSQSMKSEEYDIPGSFIPNEAGLENRCGEILGMVNSGGVLSLAGNKDIKGTGEMFWVWARKVPHSYMFRCKCSPCGSESLGTWQIKPLRVLYGLDDGVAASFQQSRIHKPHAHT